MLTVAEVAERLKMNQQTNSTLSEMFHLTPKRVGQIVAKTEAESAEPLSAVDAERELQAMLAGLDQILNDFAVGYERSEPGGDRIAAIRGRVEVLMLRLELRARAGLLPRSLAQPAQQAEVAALLTDFVRMLEWHHASDAMLREALEITERVHGGRLRPAVEATTACPMSDRAQTASLRGESDRRRNARFPRNSGHRRE